MPTATVPAPRRAMMRTVLAAVCVLAGCRGSRDAAASDPARDPVAHAQALLGDGVRDAIPLRANGEGASAALVAGTGAEGARWLVLLGDRGIRGRVRTYLPVQDTAGRFGAADWDGDGNDEAFAIGTAWSIMGVTVEVIGAEPRGRVYRYELTAIRGGDDAGAVWSPNLRARPKLMGWMAAEAYRVLPEIRRYAESRWSNTPIVRDWTPLTDEDALEAARQRLGWGVREAIPLGRPYSQGIVVLMADGANGPAERIVRLWGGDHVYDVMWEKDVAYGGWIHDHAGRFGLVDVDGDTTPEIFEINDASGSGAWAVVARLLDSESGEVYEAYAEGSWEDAETGRTRDLAITRSANVAAKRGARVWLDSALRAATSADYGDGGARPAGERRAVTAERAWSEANGERHAGLLASQPVRGPVPGTEHGSCAVDDGGVEWVARYGGGLWMHDRARDESRVLLVTPWYAQLTSVVAGRRYVWTDLVVADSARSLALLAYDRRSGALVSFPAPELALLLPPYEIFTPPLRPMAYACTGVCSAGDPLQVRDGTLAIGDVTLTLPPAIRASGELANAKLCKVRR